MAAVEFLKRRCVIAVQLVPSQRRGYAPEHLLVGTLFSRNVDQLVAAARGISVREEQRNAELFREPVVEAPVPTLDRCPDFSGVRQEHIAVSAAGIKKVRPSDAAEGQQLVCVMLHRKFKKERAASQGTQGLVRCDCVDELLDAGKIRRVKKKRLLVHELLFLVEKALLELCFVLICEILADADADGGCSLQMVKERNIWAFRCVGARWEGAEVAFQQTQQGVEPLLRARKLCEPRCQRVHGCLILRRRQSIQIFKRQMQRACLQSRQNGFSGMLPIHMGKHGHKRQITPETCFFRVYAAPVGSGGDIVRDAGDPRDAAVRRLRSAQCSGMVQADAVENVPVILPKLFQVRIAEAAVIAGLSARTQHRLTDVVQQTAEADAHAFFSQRVSRSFFVSCPLSGM